MGMVLIADDDLDTRETLRDVLVDAGYQVTLASQGAEALTELQRSESSLIALMDMFMPVMSGVEVLQRVDADPRLSAQHAYILITAAHPRDVQRLRETLPQLPMQILHKPFDINDLLLAVETAASALALILHTDAALAD